MVYFKCIGCDIKWTKLIANGCPTCVSPCQVVDDTPSMNWIRTGENAGPYGHPSGPGMTFSDDNFLEAEVEYTDTEEDESSTKVTNLAGPDQFQIGDWHGHDEDDNQLVEQDRGEWSRNTVSIREKGEKLNSAKATDDRSNSSSPTFKQLDEFEIFPHLLCVTNIDESP